VHPSVFCSLRKTLALYLFFFPSPTLAPTPSFSHVLPFPCGPLSRFYLSISFGFLSLSFFSSFLNSIGLSVRVFSVALAFPNHPFRTRVYSLEYHLFPPLLSFFWVVIGFLLTTSSLPCSRMFCSCPPINLLPILYFFEQTLRFSSLASLFPF